MELKASRDFDIDSNSPKSEQINCPDGTHVHGVGALTSGRAGPMCPFPAGGS
jgi:hypothetical protein